MELKEFMQKFSTEGAEEFLQEDGNKSRGFNIKNFPAALQNFADRLCEKQRGNCGHAYIDYNDEDTEYESVSCAIFEAEQPKIEQL